MTHEPDLEPDLEPADNAEPVCRNTYSDTAGADEPDPLVLTEGRLTVDTLG